MPFRLKLRRTRRYNVLSKNYFVTRIRLLDSNVIECTLSVESTGQECLEAVAQRLELREVSGDNATCCFYTTCQLFLFVFGSIYWSKIDLYNIFSLILSLVVAVIQYKPI